MEKLKPKRKPKPKPRKFGKVSRNFSKLPRLPKKAPQMLDWLFNRLNLPPRSKSYGQQLKKEDIKSLCYRIDELMEVDTHYKS